MAIKQNETGKSTALENGKELDFLIKKAFFIGTVRDRAAEVELNVGRYRFLHGYEAMRIESDLMR